LITAIIVAVVALVSTIVGATIGAVTNYVLAVRRERADSDKDNRSHAIEVRRAARLIDAELLQAQAAAGICIEKKHWWSGDVQPLATEAWKKYSAIIAVDLSDRLGMRSSLPFRRSTILGSPEISPERPFNRRPDLRQHC
jgi:hypothetical protein